MKYALIASVVAISTSAFAQQPAEYVLKMTPAEVDIVNDGLQTQPFGKVFPLINKLRQQIIDQQPKQAAPDKPSEGK
jgi:hypothetical protein